METVAFTVFIAFVAGIGAGLGTGLAGMSAAVVVSPMLITFLGVDPYIAIGVALASDVLASAVSAYTYGKNKHLDIKNGMAMMIPVLIFTLLGSILSSYVPPVAMGNMSLYATVIMGLKFLIAPVNTKESKMQNLTAKERLIRSLITGTAIGLVCGFIGAGGGIMMLMILTLVLGYELKTAVGTSVFIMAFTALTGAVSHFVIGGMPDMLTLIVAVLSTLLWARLAALFANKASTKTLNRTMGCLLTVMGIGMIAFNFFMG
ncbi:MAG: sulfite exporter TauE/SafE family protein [Eubacteriales bacterium]